MGKWAKERRIDGHANVAGSLIVVSSIGGGQALQATVTRRNFFPIRRSLDEANFFTSSLSWLLCSPTSLAEKIFDGIIYFHF
ncbi:hypothetical protein GOP47_0016521 [Adiantum capillus-veneris]|uniref:Uncharacterized protein n=1 Tax=Adiantum capillus-veneris TaxID=13818 RepID=A0A9D4UIU9_ADICA|nr:hypothetical protein GOP47_0016521 [Adiantum capillus-veneris]